MGVFVGMTRILAVTVAALIAGWHAADALTPSGVLLAAAALAVAGLILLTARRPTSAALHGLARPAASYGDRTIFVRHRDPSAAGRPRPRAPTPLGGAARG